MPRGYHVVPTVERSAVEDVPLRQPARRTRGPVVGRRSAPDVIAEVSGQVHLHEPQAALACKLAGIFERGRAVALDTEADVKPVDAIAEV